MINATATALLRDYYPEPNTTADLNTNLLPDDYVKERQVRNDRDNFDFKLTWQRTGTHNVWGKFAVLDAEVIDNFILGFDNGSLGDTRNYVATVGHTWTLGLKLVLDGNFGVNRMDQQVTGPDYGQNIGSEVLRIAGTTGRPSVRADCRSSTATTTSARHPTGCR